MKAIQETESKVEHRCVAEAALLPAAPVGLRICVADMVSLASVAAAAVADAVISHAGGLVRDAVGWPPIDEFQSMLTLGQLLAQS